MTCYVCNIPLIWGGDEDIDPEEGLDHKIVTNLSCQQCGSIVHVYHGNKLKISHFKELYKSLKTPFPPINFLILGMLIGLENRWINLKTEQTVDMAIDDYHAKMDELSEPVYKAVIEETEDGGFTIGYFPEAKEEDE